jgi:hypothetical protein
MAGWAARWAKWTVVVFVTFWVFLAPLAIVACRPIEHVLGPLAFLYAIVAAFVLVAVGGPLVKWLVTPRERMQPVARCPYCSRKLATAEAQQCLACGAEWRDGQASGMAIRAGSAARCNDDPPE